jgi:hypothetical protein
MALATATGVPNPAAPSMNAPNANAISSALHAADHWSSWPTESLMASNLPVSERDADREGPPRLRSSRSETARTRRRRWPRLPDFASGIWYSKIATRTGGGLVPESAAIQAGWRRTAQQKQQHEDRQRSDERGPQEDFQRRECSFAATWRKYHPTIRTRSESCQAVRGSTGDSSSFDSRPPPLEVRARRLK